MWSHIREHAGVRVPRVDPALCCPLIAALHTAIGRGLVRSCHDLSEGGLAVAIAEMALAGGLGARVDLTEVAHEDDANVDLVILFSESPTRFLIEVTPTCWDEVIEVFRGLPLGRLGLVTGVAGNGKGDSPRLTVHGLDHSVVIDAAVADLKTVWQRPLAWS